MAISSTILPLFLSPPFGDPEKVDYSPYQLTGTVKVTQVIYSGSKIKNSIDQRVVERKMAEYSAVKTASDVRMSIVNEYLKLFSLMKDYYINVQTIQQIELRLKTLRSKFINGQVVKNDVSRSELQKSDFELKLLRTVSNASATNYFLTLLLGLPENTVIAIDTNVNYKTDTTFVFEECLTTAFANRPEYQLALASKDLSVNSLKIIKGTYYPTIHGVGLYGLQNPVPGTFPPEANFLSFLTVGAGINYSLGSLYKASHQKSSAELAVQREEQDAADMKIKISDEVKTQFTQYEMQRQALAIYEKKIQFAGENYRIIQSRYYNDQALNIRYGGCGTGVQPGQARPHFRAGADTERIL
jgi:outer membrane protein TolC